MTATATDPAVAAPDAPPPAAGGPWGLVGAAAAYLVLGAGLWWDTWSTHPSTVTTCGCGDAARFLWYFRWPAVALTHGHDVLYSTYLFHPGGINLLDDTSVVALAVVLAPVTWAFGPVAAMNVALTLAPALSALAMFVLLRRWVRWTPAAFVGGLVYGFSPFVVTELALNQLNIAFLAVPPLIVLVLADLLVTQRRRPWVDGLALAGLVVAQFFIGTEVLVITVVAVLVGLVLLVTWSAVRRPDELSARLGRALRGGAVAVGASAAVLAYPLWFLLDGPAHLVGPIWSAGATTRYGTSLSSFVSTGGLGGLRASMLQFGGYQGPVLVGLGYLGLGVLVVAVVGTVVWRHDRRMLLFAGVGVVAAVLSLGPGHGYPVPWDALQHLPWIGDVVEVRFTLVAALCAAVLVALALDHARRGLSARGVGGHRAAGPLSWLLVLVVLVPTVVALGPNLPLTTRTVVLPAWYARTGGAQPPGHVVLAYPIPSSGLQSSEAWQAVNAMAWAQASGGGPQGQPSRAGGARPGFEVLSAASLPLGPAPVPDPAAVAAVRSALRQWRVTTVVVPDQAGLPVYERGRGGPYAAAFFTAVLGELPVHVDRAWVWDGVATAPRPAPVTRTDFARCLAPPPAPVDRLAVPECILGTPTSGGA